jgi:hypothetical protein
MAARGYRMVRYADDFVILCRTREAADAALDEVRAWVEANGLTLHPEKTHVGDCRVPGQGFEFLGYRLEAGRRSVRKKSLDKLKDTIQERTRRTRGDSLDVVIADLNRVLRGWFGYFKLAQSRTFIDSTSSSVAGFASSCANRRSDRVSGAPSTIKSAGQMPTSRMPGCSRFTRPGEPRDSLDEETTDWRPVCGKTARTVRRAGSAQADPDPYQNCDRRAAVPLASTDLPGHAGLCPVDAAPVWSSPQRLLLWRWRRHQTRERRPFHAAAQKLVES